MALLAAPPPFSDARMFCDTNYQGTESTALEIVCCLCFRERKMIGVDDCFSKINFLKGYTEYDGLEKSASCTVD